MLDQPWVASIGRLVSSEETKALETAAILGEHLGLDVDVRPGIGENDRTATGFVPPDEFEQLADAFFAEPEASVQGWERASDAQSRIVAGLSDLLQADGADTAIVGPWRRRNTLVLPPHQRGNQPEPRPARPRPLLHRRHRLPDCIAWVASNRPDRTMIRVTQLRLGHVQLPDGHPRTADRNV